MDMKFGIAGNYLWIEVADYDHYKRIEVYDNNKENGMFIYSEGLSKEQIKEIFNQLIDEATIL